MKKGSINKCGNLDNLSHFVKSVRTSYGFCDDYCERGTIQSLSEFESDDNCNDCQIVFTSLSY